MSNYAVTTYLEAEVKCLHCGHTSGVIRRDQKAPRGLAMFVSQDGSEPRPIRSLADIRCAHCGGPVYTDEFDVRYVYPKVDFFDERPRRGRPPKRLVELRRAQAEEAARKSA